MQTRLQKKKQTTLTRDHQISSPQPTNHRTGSETHLLGSSINVRRPKVTAKSEVKRIGLAHFSSHQEEQIHQKLKPRHRSYAKSIYRTSIPHARIRRRASKSSSSASSSRWSSDQVAQYLNDINIPNTSYISKGWTSTGLLTYTRWIGQFIRALDMKKHYEIMDSKRIHSDSRPSPKHLPPLSANGPHYLHSSLQLEGFFHLKLELSAKWESFHDLRGYAHRRKGTSGDNLEEFNTLSNYSDTWWKPGPVGEESSETYAFHTIGGERVYRMRKDVAKDGLLVANSKSMFERKAESNVEPNSCTRLRYIWDMMASMDFTRQNWVSFNDDSLQLRDDEQCTGNIVRNDHSDNADIISSGGIARLSFVQTCSDELTFSVRAARCFADILGSIELLPVFQFPVKHLDVFRFCKMTTQLDLAFLPNKELLPWSMDIAPILLAAQYSDESEDEMAESVADEQLAEAFHDTILLFILYYLDTRISLDEPLPLWMVCYGILYTEQGFSVWSFCPAVRSTGAPEMAPRLSWSVECLRLSRFDDIFTAPANRNQSFATLLHLNSHARMVAQKLAEWDGYERSHARHLLAK